MVMKDGTASRTAQSVAAHRLEYDRLGADYGDPAAELSLTADVAAGLEPAHGRMHDYLRKRTAFFDRVLVSALDRGVRQVVIGGAGYDGRALRYAKPGVAWFELDHPATQADKRERVARLALDAGHVRFVAADFTADPIAPSLLAAGLDPARPTLFLLEGVIAYLERPVTERVLAAFREVAADGSELAISVSTGTATAESRARFEQRVADMGEPARSRVTPDQAWELLTTAGWQRPAEPDLESAAGLVLARAGPAARPGGRAPRRPQPFPQSGLPLSALLSAALVAFTIDADNEAERRLPHTTTNEGRSDGAQRGAPWLTSLVMWANCLRHVPADGITVAELRRRARTGTNLDGMRRWGYVRYAPSSGDRGKRPGPDATVTLTAAGRQAQEVWQAVAEQTEARWRARFGPDAIDRLRAALADVVARLDPALPDCLPVLGYTLRSTVEPEPTAAPGDSIAPDAADLPLWALLSRALLAFAVEYEREPGPSLAISATVLRVLTPDGVHSRDLPALAGISKEAVAMAVGRLAENGLATEGPDPAGGRLKVTRLTAAGTAAQAAYADRIAAIESGWRARLGQDRVAALRAALEPLAEGDPPPLLAAIEPRDDNWRARVPPPRLLPHYPMTLHRAGYPDGA